MTNVKRWVFALSIRVFDAILLAVSLPFYWGILLYEAVRDRNLSPKLEERAESTPAAGSRSSRGAVPAGGGMKQGPEPVRIEEEWGADLAPNPLKLSGFDLATMS
jgi:hypothetical protein